jgi:TP901-1 family phage major tail protein
MAAKKGYSFILKQGTTAAGTVLGGLRDTSIRITSEAVDVTTKTHSGVRQLLEGAGVTSITINANGVFEDDAAYDTVLGYAKANSINAMGLVDGDGNTFDGLWQVTSFETSGSYNGAQMYSLTLESAGTITYVNV